MERKLGLKGDTDLKRSVDLMACVSFWKEKILFCDGWFLYLDGKGNHSVISQQCARQLELKYQSYQASMDMGRGGLPKEVAYPARGFRCVDGNYVYTDYAVDKLIGTGSVRPVEGVMMIPEELMGIRINWITKRAFENETGLVQVILPDGISKIDESAFEGCTNLREIKNLSEDVHIGADAFKNTALFSGQRIEYLGHALIRVEPSFSGILKIGEGTTSIADCALQGCAKLEEVLFPSGLRIIGKAAFEGCTKLKRILLPQLLQKIETGAFQDCENLAELVFPQKLDTIGERAFAGCSALERVELPDGINEIKRALFEGCRRLTEVHIPDSVTRIYPDAFEGTGLLERYLESEDEELYLGQWLIHYKGSAEKTLSVKAGTIGIADLEFLKSKKISAVHFPGSLKYIGADAFRDADLHRIELPGNLLYIGKSAFKGTKIKEILIPASVDTVEQWAFQSCEELEKITIKGSKTNIVWPAITGRRDKEPIIITAPDHSPAAEYCDKYGAEYHLSFQPLRYL